MLIIGTALAVFPFNSVVHEAEKSCPRVLINLQNLEHNFFDFDNLLESPERLLLQGRAQETIQKLCEDVGWTKDLQNLIQECEKKYPKVEKNKQVENAKDQSAVKASGTAKK